MLLSVVLKFAPSSGLHHFLLLFQRSSIDFVHVFPVRYLFLTAVRILFIIPIKNQSPHYKCLPKYSLDFIVQTLSTISHVKDLQSLFHCDSAFESLVIHQELHYVEQFPWLQPRFIRDTPSVHCLKLFLAHIPV